MTKFHVIDLLSDKISFLHNAKKIILLFTIVLLCIIWSDLYFKIINERQIAIQHAVEEADNFTRAFEEHTIQTIRSIDQIALFLKYDYEKDGHLPKLGQYIKQGRFGNQPVILISIVNEKGDVIASSQDQNSTSNIKEQEEFLVHKEFDSGQVYISKPILGHSSSQWSIQVTRRINKTDGSFGGVVLISVDPNYFSEFYNQVDLGQDSTILIIGADGILRARKSDGYLTMGRDMHDSLFWKNFTNREIEHFAGYASDKKNAGHYEGESSIDAIGRYYSYRVVNEYPFIVVTGISKTEVLREVERRAVRYEIITILVTVVILFFTVLLLLISKRQKHDEEALRKSQDVLENKVVQRTKELSIVNQELSARNQEQIKMNEVLQDMNQELEEEIAERLTVEEVLRKKNVEIHHMAYYDNLTGLPNRAYLQKWFAQQMEKVTQGAALGTAFFIDLDNLKMINDSFGHSMGDMIIKIAGKRIDSALGSQAVVVRLGGDEFIAVISGETDPAAVIPLARKVIFQLGQEYQILDNCFYMTASVGIATYPADGCILEEIIKNADNAMYSAKRSGKNCWKFYTEEMQQESYKTILLMNSLRNAILRKELFLQYQPQVKITDNRIRGFEALVRWQSTEYGLISPARFIPLAEKNGLIQTIGEWVMLEACKFARRLADQGWGHIQVSVNVSPYQLCAAGFIENVKRAITQAGIQACQLELEITESALIRSLEETIRILNELKTLGVNFALDDFGTGYSSLTYLQRLPVTTLKIDKSFIDQMLANQTDTMIIKTIIDLAKILGMSVIAEGVEIQQQMNQLKDCDCDYVQGYLVSRPISENEAIDILK